MQLAAKVKISADSYLPRGVSCAMEMRMKDGAVYSSQVDYTKGSMENPMTEEERKDKFNTLASAILSTEKRKTIISMVERLEELENLPKLYELLY